MATNSTAGERTALLKELFPAGVPRLWCPPLTHYDSNGKIDGKRIAAHLTHLSPHVKGLLIPGSTGDGWDLSDAETEELLELALDLAQKLQLNLLIGALKKTSGEVLTTINKVVQRIEARTRERDANRALAKARVSGFAVCAPQGKEISQQEMARSFSAILELGLPTALYQLPQVTQNEFSPEVAAGLAQRFPNFIMLKDSSWADRVVLSGKSLDGVFAMRGAEGEYARWLKAAGGPYDGFLLSTANCFARELNQMLADVAAQRREAAERISTTLSAVIAEVFELVKGLPQGNAFTNANKAMDHFFAHGQKASDVRPPRLHSGEQLPPDVIRRTSEILSGQHLMPATGYL
jgi:dihydrodipicolinate synthase/N-acetylneuraminate lyase